MIWWVIYDIAGDKRLRRVSKLCRRAGLRQVQKSVYAGVLSQNQVLALREVLVGEIKSDEDRVLLLPVTEQSINASVTLGIDSGLNDFLVRVSIHSEGDGFVAVSQLLGHAGHISTVGDCDAGKGVPICYNKDKSGNPLKIKENRTCPYSFSNHIPSKIRPLRP